MSAAPRVLVAGGGVAALEAVLALLDRAPELPIELVAADSHFVNRPLSVLDPFAAGSARTVPPRRLADRGVAVRQARLTAVDPARGTVTTGEAVRRGYDVLLVALGARALRPFEHALTFRGPRDAEALHGLVQDVDAGTTRRVAFVAAPGVAWLLPLYELALQLAARARQRCLADVEISLVTPGHRPLEVFGRTGSSLVECLLEEAGIVLVTGANPAVPEPGRVVARPGCAGLTADRIVTLPRLEGLVPPGLAAAPSGFLPVDEVGRLPGTPGVYAAGDGTDRPVKQGGLAAQYADRAVGAMLADLGRADPVPPEPLQVRAMLVTGDEA